MRIAINTRFLIRNKLEGLGWYTYEIARRLALTYKDDHFIFLFDRAYDPTFHFSENITSLAVSPQARHPILFKIWFDFSLPAILKKQRADVFLSLDGFCSLKYDGKTVLVIHDLAYRHFPKHVSSTNLAYYQKNMPKFIRKADRVIAISESVAKDIIELEPSISMEKLKVIHNGVREDFRPSTETEKEETKALYADGCDYFIFVGAIHPRKNVYGIVKAFEEYKSKGGRIQKLVLCGRFAWKSDYIYQAIKESPEAINIIRIENAETEHIVLLMGAAFALLYPSFHEGFGLPIVEAFRSEVPVLTSNISSMPEVAGDAAILVDPNNKEAIVKGMFAFEQESFRREMISRGLEQVKLFDWQKTAESIYEVMRELVTNKDKH